MLMNSSPLKQDVRKGVGRSAIECKLGSDTNANHHEAQLIDHAVGKHPAQIIFDDGVENREGGHQQTDPDKNLGTVECRGQCIDSHFRCECRQHYRPGHGRLGVGIHEPVVQQGKCTLDSKCEKDQQSTRRTQVQLCELNGSAGARACRMMPDNNRSPEMTCTIR